MELTGYDHFVAAAARVGLRILVVAGTILVADIVAMVIYTIRQGQSDGQEGNV